MVRALLHRLEKPGRTWMAMLTLLALVPFLPALGAGFVFDDNIAIAGNPYVTGPFDVLGIFDSGFWGGDENSNVGSYRPITVLTFALDHRISGGKPWSFHGTNVLLHVLCVLSIYMVLRRRWSHGPAAVIALVFAVHALHTENVAGLVGRADVLATLLGLWAWELSRTGNWKHLTASGVLFLLALLSKEVAIAFLGLTIAEVVLNLSRDQRPIRVRLLPVVAMLAAFAIYMLLRMQAIATFAAPIVAQANPLVSSDSVASQIWTASALLTRTCELLLFPAALSADYSYAEILPLESPWNFSVIVGLALWLCLPLAALTFRKKAPAASLGLLLFLAAYVPISNLILVVPSIFGERLQYLPSLGLIIAATMALRSLWHHERYKQVLAAALLVVVAGNAARSFVRTQDWRSPRTLFTSATRIAPNSAKNWFNLGVAALEEDRTEEAQEHLERSLSIFPDQPLAHSFIGVALEKQGRPKDAHVAMFRAMRMRPWCRMCALNLVSLYTKYGFFENAHRELERFKKAGGHPATVQKLSTFIAETEERARAKGEKPRPFLGP